MTFQEKVAQSEMVMVYLSNSPGVDSLGISLDPSRTPWYIAWQVNSFPVRNQNKVHNQQERE